MDHYPISPNGFLHNFYAWALYEIAVEGNQAKRLMNRMGIGNLVGHVEACLPLTDEQLDAGLKCLSVSYEEVVARARRLCECGDLPRLREKPKVVRVPPIPKGGRRFSGARLNRPPPPWPVA